MKTIFTLFLLLVSGTIYAQRTADIAVTITSPASPLVIEAEEVYVMEISVRNDGPDAITEADTLKMMMTVSGDTVNFPPQGDYLVYNENIAVGETVVLTHSSLFDDSMNDSEFPVCVIVTPVNAISSVVDDSTLNNRDCITVQLGSQVGISENAASLLLAHPNPAKDRIYLDVPNDAQIVVTDASGSRIRNPDFQNGSLDCSEWKSGIYFITALSGGKKSAARITVLR